MMLSKEEQLGAILSSTNDILRWAVQQLPTGQMLKDKKYSDFINVTLDDVTRYALEHGFPPALVYESSGSSNSVATDDRLCIVQDSWAPKTWVVFYTERGKGSHHAYFSYREEAFREVAQRLINSTKFLLNANYRTAHPELNLPSPMEMD